MSRNLVVTVVVVILIILGAGAYMFMNKPATPATPVQTASEPSIQPSPAMEKTSLKSFMSMAGSQKCDFSDADSSNAGTVFVDSGKFRGDFSSNAGGKVSLTHMINDGKDVYIWMDDQQTGFKTSMQAVEQMSGQTGVQQTVDLNKQVDYKCEPWTVDPVMYVVPKDKKFTDMSKMMEDAMKRMPSVSPNASGTTAEDNAAACSACNNLEGDSQAQCKKALKCN